MDSFYFTTEESASGFYIHKISLAFSSQGAYNRSVYTQYVHIKKVLTMTTTRVFQNGNSQALRIPQEMRTDKMNTASAKSGTSSSLSPPMTHGLQPVR